MYHYQLLSSMRMVALFSPLLIEDGTLFPLLLIEEGMGEVSPRSQNLLTSLN
jgi:hypothetical protein